MRAAILSAVLALTSGLNTRPIIGILSMPNHQPYEQNVPGYFPASYVKWLEMSGARVVPLPYNRPDDVLALLPSINGALFTGGGASFTNKNGSLTTFTKTASLIFNEVVSAAAAGETWPLWGTCLGFELISFIASGFNTSTLTSGFDSENLTLALDFAPAAKTSVLYGSMPPGVVEIFGSQNVTMNNHQQGVAPEDFAAAPSLAGRFKVLSTNVDRGGRPFVSSLEGDSLPIYATQYHPEKPQFEWDPTEVIPHFYDAVHANLWPGLVFVNQTRLNNRSFPTPEAEAAALIYNYPAVYTAAQTSFEQMYFM